MTDDPKSQDSKSKLVYRGKDGRPHLVEEQEKAAREAQQEAEKPAPNPLPGLANSPPD